MKRMLRFSPSLNESLSFLNRKIGLTQRIKNPNRYIKALYHEYKEQTFDEMSALSFKGKWRDVFLPPVKGALHLEIGPGNGKHFAQLCHRKKTEGFLALELRYKAIIQTARRVKKPGEFQWKSDSLQCPIPFRSFCSSRIK